jgi:hypothetical protein
MIEKLLMYKKYFLLAFVIVLLSIFVLALEKESLQNNEVKENNVISISNESTSVNEDIFYVDVKGAVKKPAVYEFKDGDKIIDQTTPNMIQRISDIFARNPLISSGL